jgi:LysM repeat protein
MLCRAVRREPSPISIRRTLATTLAIGAFALLGASSLGAQEQAPQSHTVKRGDTLWDLAKLYLGDSFLWPEIYRLNTDVIDDPHWIYPGELLKLPAPGTTPTVAEGPTVKQAGEPASPPVPEPAPAAAPAPASAPVTAATGAPVYEPPIGVLDGPTVFPKQRAEVAATRRKAATPAPTPVVKLGVFLTAPFVDRSGGPRGAGAILQVVNLSVSAAGQSPKERAQLHDELLIKPPVGSAASEGDRYVTYAIGPSIDGVGQVIIPTGVVQVTRAPRDREATEAQVTRMFGEIFADQRLMPYDSTVLQFVARPQPSSDSLVARVRLIPGGAILPSIEDYLIVDASSDDGVRIGDEFELYDRRHRIDGSGGYSQPDLPIAHAQVVRVTRYGTTLMITEHAHPKIEEGTYARRVATMP